MMSSVREAFRFQFNSISALCNVVLQCREMQMGYQTKGINICLEYLNCVMVLGNHRGH